MSKPETPDEAAEAARADLMARLQTLNGKPTLTIADATSILWGPGVNSHERLTVMLHLMIFRPAEECWPVFLHFYDTCDDTNDLAIELLEMLEDWNGEAPMADFLDEEAAAFYRALPEAVTVYRGGNAGEWLTGGISWTTDRKVALTFARGHRGLRNREPSIATGKVRKSDILGVFIDRQESEILTAPRFVFDLKIEAVGDELERKAA